MIFWNLKRIPELAPLSEEERRMVHYHCMRNYFWYAPLTFRSIMACLFYFITFMIIMMIGGEIIKVMGFKLNIFSTLGLIVVSLLLCSYIFTRIVIAVLRPSYRKFIEEYYKDKV